MKVAESNNTGKPSDLDSVALSKVWLDGFQR